MTKLYPFQKEGVRLIEKFDGRVLLADEQGLGKTIQALIYLKRHPKIRPAVIVCPASVKYVWEEQAKRHCGLTSVICQSQTPPKRKLFHGGNIFIINYDILLYWSNYLRDLHPKIVICDECFPYDTPVLTEKGWLPIGRIVEDRAPLRIASYNFSKNAVDFQSIVRYIKTRRHTNMVKVSWEGGSVVCTTNHKLWIEGKGFIYAGEIQTDDKVRVVSQTLCNAKRVQEAVLQQVMLCQMEDASTRDQRNHAKSSKTATHIGVPAALSQDGSRKTTCQTIQRSDEEKQSKLVKTNTCQSTEDKRASRNPSHLEGEEGWQRDIHQATNTPLETSRPRLEIGIADQDPSEIPISNSLQSGYREPTIEDSDRGRRQRTSDTVSKSQRQKENSLTQVVRVDSVEILKQGGSEPSQQNTPDDPFVYNLEIERNHNYFASGVLVSNCHMLKSRGIQRTRAVRKLCTPIRRMPIDGIAMADTHNMPPDGRGFREDDEVEFIDKSGETLQGIITSLSNGIATIKTIIPHLMGLSGTPLTNRPEELWTTLNLIWPQYFSAFTPYAWEFCEPEMTPYGWKYSGAANLDVLHKRLKRIGMIRRLKRDVLQDLPTKRRIVVPLDIDNRADYNRAVHDFLNWLHARDAAKAKKARHAERLVQMAYLRRLAAEGKVKAVSDWIDSFLEETNDKLVVGALHHSVIDALHEHYRKTSVTFTGKTSVKKRRAALLEFRRDDSKRIIIGQIKAIGTGVDGLQEASSTSAVIELPWDPGTMSQFDDRIHRIGQKKSVTIYYLVAHNTIEEKLCHIIQKKQEVLTRTLDGEQNLERMKIDIWDQLTEELLKGDTK